MINLEVPGNAVGIVEIASAKNIGEDSWPINHRRSVRGKGGYSRTLKLFERSDVQRDLVKKKANSAAHYCLSAVERDQGETSPRGEVVLSPNLIAIKTNSQVKSYSFTWRPLVLDES